MKTVVVSVVAPIVFLIGALVILYLAGKLIFKCVRLFRSGNTSDALWLASALCAMIGIGIFNLDFLLSITFLGFMYFVIRGFWLFLHWIDGIPVGSLDNHDRGVNDGVNGLSVLNNDRVLNDPIRSSSHNGLTIGPEGAGSYVRGIRIDSDLGIDHGSSFDDRW